MNTCRFCNDESQEMVKYGVRHYAHFRCYLESGRTLDKLPAWKVGQFPQRLLKEKGLIDEALKLILKEDARSMLEG